MSYLLRPMLAAQYRLWPLDWLDTTPHRTLPEAWPASNDIRWLIALARAGSALDGLALAARDYANAAADADSYAQRAEESAGGQPRSERDTCGIAARDVAYCCSAAAELALLEVPTLDVCGILRARVTAEVVEAGLVRWCRLISPRALVEVPS